MGFQPLSALFVSCSFIFYPLHLSPFQIFQNWWIIHLRVSNSISKISIAYVFYNPPQSDTINHQSQTPRLDWSNLPRLRFVITCSPSSLLVTPSPLVSTPPWAHYQNHASPLFLPSFTPIPVVVPVVLFLGLGLSHTLSLCFLLSTIPSVILCSRTHCAALFCSRYACICWRTNKNS